MITTNTYLNFPGTCEEAFKTYEKLLGGKIGMIMRFSEAPGMPIDPGFEDKIMHIRMSLGDTALMGSDAPPSRYKQPQGFSVSVSTDDPAGAERIFAGLAQGGSVDMPIQETFWAKRFGMCTDGFGIAWMINCEKES